MSSVYDIELQAFFRACEKNELPVSPVPRNNNQRVSIEMDTNEVSNAVVCEMNEQTDLRPNLPLIFIGHSGYSASAFENALSILRHNERRFFKVNTAARFYTMRRSRFTFAAAKFDTPGRLILH